MEDKKSYLQLFQVKKPIVGMLHLKGSSDDDVLLNAMREIDILIGNGIDAVLVENYFGRTKINRVVAVLDYLYNNHQRVTYGINLLGNYELAFELANEYKASFIQVDSIAGHLNISSDMIFDKKIKKLRETSKAFLIGGVRFKYQPYESGRSLEEDLKIGMTRCDGIVVTGNGTGEQTDLVKIKEFRKIVKEFPLIVGAGLTADNCQQQLSIADAGIVGSYLKENHVDFGDVSPYNTQQFMQKVKMIRR